MILNGQLRRGKGMTSANNGTTSANRNAADTTSANSCARENGCAQENATIDPAPPRITCREVNQEVKEVATGSLRKLTKRQQEIIPGKK